MRTPPDSEESNHVRRVLQERARALATVPAREVESESIDLLTFTIGRERFAFESRHVVDVFRVTSLSLLPPAAAPFIAITEWKGDLLTLLDLKKALGSGGNALTDRSLVITLGSRHATLGVLADSVSAHEGVPLVDIGAAPPATAASQRYIRGITPDAILIVDALALQQSQ